MNSGKGGAKVQGALRPGGTGWPRDLWRFGLVFLLISLPTLLVLAYHMHASRQSARATAEVQVRNLALAVESKIRDTLRRAEAAATYLAELASDGVVEGPLADQRARAVSRQIELSMMDFPGQPSAALYANPQGNLSFTLPSGEVRRFNIAQRDYFQRQAEDPEISTFFSAPLADQVRGRTTLVVSRAVRSASGVFQGIALVTLHVDVAEELFATLELGPGGVVALNHLDSNQPMARHPAPGALDDLGQAQRAVRETLLAGQQEGVLDTTHTRDGPPRIYAYRRIANTPYFLTLGAAQEDYLAKWQQERTLLLWAAGVFELALALVVASLARGAGRLRRAQEEAEGQRSRAESFFRMAGDGIHIVDSAGLLVDANPAFLEMVGQDTSAIGRLRVTDWDCLVTPEEVPLRIGQMMASPEPTRFESRHRRRDGGEFDVELNARPLVLDGRPLLYVSSRDVSERKQMEQALRESLARFDTVFRANPVPVSLIRLADGRFEEVNDAMVAMLGYTVDEIRGRTSLELNLWWNPAGREVLYETLRGGGAIRDVEESLRRKSGERVEGLYSASVVQLEGVPYLLVAMADITEKKHIAQELERHRNHLEELVQERTSALNTLYDSAPCGYHSLDIDGRIIAVNDTELRMLGYSREEMLAMNMRELMVPEDLSTFEQRFASFKREGYARDLDFNIRCKDGSVLPVLVSAEVVTGEGGEFLFSSSVMSDNRERKAREQEIARLTEALAERAYQAESANLAKSAFLANMSHEIRTPMNAILGMAHLLRRAGVSPQQAQQLDKIDASAKHLLAILNDILDLSKIEAGKFGLESEPIQVEALPAAVAGMVADRAHAKGLQLTVENGPLPPWLLGDATRLTQALLNFASNAVKFTEAGSITLRCRALAEEAEHVVLHFEVQDTGPGVAAQILPRLFTAFEQADNSTTRKFGGTGLGLAITRRLARLMGGDAGAQSVPGQGSRFWFTARLRRAPEGEQLSPPNWPVAELEQRLLDRHAGARLLLAEDDLINQEIAKMLLEDVGLVVDVAQDGEAVVDMAARQPYALILMDMQMPRIDGLEATRRIRRLPYLADVPILALTANAFAEDRAQCLAAGMDDFISKPVVPQVLFGMLLRWLERSHSRPGAPPGPDSDGQKPGGP